MHAGALLSRRFTLVRPHSHDLPGVERWIARDERRSREVYVDFFTTSKPADARSAAVRAAQVRDLRFTRVLATGREVLDGTRVTYAVTEIPQAVSVATLLGTRKVPPEVAAAIIGEAAHALEAATLAGIHHGHLRPGSIHILDTSRVLVSGLGTDGELALQAGLIDKTSQRADALALSRIYLALVTGLDADQVAVDDVPLTLPPRAADMARATIAGNSPASLTALVRALSPFDARVLRDVSHALLGWPWAPGAEPAPLPPAARLGLDVSLSPETIARAEQLSTFRLVGLIAAPDVTHAVHTGTAASLLAPPKPQTRADQLASEHVELTDEEAAQFSARVRRAAARESHQELGLDTWERVVADQNRTTPRSVVQAVLEWLHSRRPQSVTLEAAAEQARHLAQRPAPLRAGPILVSVFVGITLVAGLVAFEILTEPFKASDDTTVERPSHYPEFTFSPEPEPTTSPEPSPETDGQTEDDTASDS